MGNFEGSSLGQYEGENHLTSILVLLMASCGNTIGSIRATSATATESGRKTPRGIPRRG